MTSFGVRLRPPWTDLTRLALFCSACFREFVLRADRSEWKLVAVEKAKPEKTETPPDRTAAEALIRALGGDAPYDLEQTREMLEKHPRVRVTDGFAG